MIPDVAERPAPVDPAGASAVAIGPIPWRSRDLTRWTLGTWIGLTALVVAWFGASGSAELDVQYRWLNVGIAGTVVTGAANVVWLLNGLRAVRERRHRMIEALLGEEAPNEAPVPRPATDDARLVAAPSMTRYHRADCLLVAGKAVTASSLRAHRAGGRRPCGVCQSTEPRLVEVGSAA